MRQQSRRGCCVPPIGCTYAFAFTVNPSVTLCATAPLAQGSRGRISRQKITLSRPTGGNGVVTGAGINPHRRKAAHLLPPLCKGRWVCVSKAGGVVSCRQMGRTYAFAFTVNPSVSLTADSSPCTGEPGGFPGRKSPYHACRAATGSRGHVQVCIACDPSRLKFLLPTFLFQEAIVKRHDPAKSALPKSRDN